jgi:oxygen-independent coproporphyrinogen-3 oxidase
MISDTIRNKIVKHLVHIDKIEFDNEGPTYQELEEEFEEIKEIGLYLHIPFCNRICPYCPYNKELYTEAKATQYTEALKREIDIYASIMGNKPVTSFYIGGGTPTSILNKGLEDILSHVRDRLNIQCDIHLESHPNHLSMDNLRHIKALGVEYLSVGVEALQDHHLENIKRNYTVDEAKSAIERAMKMDFECVNIDFMFDLPDQTPQEIEDAARQIIEMNVDQVATYPLFNFEYAHLKNSYLKKRKALPTMFRRRKLLKILEDHFYPNDYYRSSVWAFTKEGVDKYCSVTVPLYLGLGASGSSYLNNRFFVNTFKVKDYVESLKQGSLPIATHIALNDEMQMVGWLYWRIYETKFSKAQFEQRFGVDFDDKYGFYMRKLAQLGYLKDEDGVITLTDRGTYWIHAFEDYFSINYINKLWGTLRNEPWPESIVV